MIDDSGSAFAQKRIPVEVAQAGDDPVGHLGAQELRATLRSSDGALVAPQSLEASAHPDGLRLTMELARPRIRPQLVGTHPDVASMATPIAVNIVYDSAGMPLSGAFIRSVVEICAPETAQSCAARILAATNLSLEWLRQNWPSLWKTL